MNVRQLLGALVVTALCAPAAMATTTSTARCSALENQFDKLATSSVHQEKAKAQTIRAEGAKLCSSGKQAEGVRKLEDAIKMIGGKPEA